MIPRQKPKNNVALDFLEIMPINFQRPEFPAFPANPEKRDAEVFLPPVIQFTSQTNHA